MRLTDSEQRLCDELVNDVQSLGFPGSVEPDQDTPPHVIEAACNILIAKGWEIRLNGRRVVIRAPHPDAT